MTKVSWREVDLVRQVYQYRGRVVPHNTGMSGVDNGPLYHTQMIQASFIKIMKSWPPAGSLPASAQCQAG